MQTILTYVAAPGTVGSFRDASNAKAVNPPTFVLGVSAVLKIRLFEDTDDLTPYPIGRFSGIAAWRFDLDSDFSASTVAKIAADHENIAVATVTETTVVGTDDNDAPITESQSYTEFTIPLPEMDSEELNAWLGTAASKNGLTGELLGMDGDGNDVFVLQLEGFTVRNRVIHTGEPTQADPTWLNAEQVRAIIAAGYDLEERLQDGLLQIRMRSASSSSATWSDWMPFVGIGANGHWYVGGTDTQIDATGPQGPTGATGATGAFLSI